MYSQGSINNSHNPRNFVSLKVSHPAVLVIIKLAILFIVTLPFLQLLAVHLSDLCATNLCNTYAAVHVHHHNSPLGWISVLVYIHAYDWLKTSTICPWLIVWGCLNKDVLCQVCVVLYACYFNNHCTHDL